MSRAPKCPRAKVVMDEGLLVDRGDANQVTPARWIGGPLDLLESYALEA
jgi:hypothetical protein